MNANAGDVNLSVRWRSVAILATSLLLALGTALVVLASVQDAGTLETVALVLAVIAFVSQLLIFVAQLSFAANQLQQAERINSETSTVLADVSSRVARLDETQLQQFTEIREQLLPQALGMEMVDSIDRAVDIIAKENPQLATLLESELAGVRETIEAKTERHYTHETVRCPFGHHDVPIRIGSVAGDSATGECATCHRRFHVHRAADGSVFAVRPGGEHPTEVAPTEPEALLRREGMQLPDTGDRLRLLAQFVDEWRNGRIKRGADVTNWMDHPSRVRTPFFFALVNQMYGPLELIDDPALRAAEMEVSPPTPDFDEDEWISLAHSAWIAQAIYRLRGWRRNRHEELRFFFGPDSDADDEETMARALEFDRLVRDSSEVAPPGEPPNGTPDVNPSATDSR